MHEPDFEEGGVAIRRGWWRQVTRAGRVRIQGARLTLMNSYGAQIDSDALHRVRVTRPWFAPKGLVRLAMAGNTYWLRLGPERAHATVEAATTRQLRA
ncbi:hypothetical protein [Streptomyces sp. MNU89]|uniref:hypothetical protein n=1 Tax=Streptomyces sp. MNU89 TaxID=2560025 RepID=UPI001E465C4C|nr:hypothetical protein [Streptomyces sp. MNU89]MCC9738459.1 hypothetical protein [Streptomyces sp. MNU89]